jgi:outer membrane protein
VVAPLHRFDPSSPPLFDETLLQGHLVLGYTLFDGGARGARVRRAEAGAAAASEGEREVRMDLAVQVSAAYLSVLSARELLEASEALSAALESELDRIRQLLAEGKAARVDLLRVQAALSRADASEISARTDRDVALGDLARIIGRPAEEIRAGGLSPLPRLGSAPVNPQEALEAAQARSPTLARTQRELAGAEAGLNLARAEWLPRLEAVGRFTNYGTWSGNHTQEWQAGVSLAFPIFTGGARAGTREAARALVDEVTGRVRMAELEVEAGVERGLAAVAEASALSRALETAVEQSEEVARIEALALEAGAGVQTDFLRAEAELFQTRASLAQARNAEVLARIQLARIMGELSPRWIQENVEGDQ